jgi:hypothetical protein
MDQNSIEVIKKLLDSGKTVAEVKQEFLLYGWPEEIVDQMISQATQNREDISIQQEIVPKNNNFGIFLKALLVLFLIIGAGLFIYANRNNPLFEKDNKQVEKQLYSKEEKITSLPTDAEINECNSSLDFLHVGCSFKTNNKYQIVYDGKFSNEYQEILYKSLIFSPDGNQFAYIARDSDKWIAVLNGYPSSAYDQILYPVFSPDSSNFYYTYKKDNKWALYQNATTTQFYDNPVYPVFSLGENKGGYIINEQGKEYFVLNDLKSDAWDDILKNTLEFSKDGQSYIYSAKAGDSWYVIYNSEKFGPYQAVLETEISDDGKNFAYNANINGQWYLIKNDNNPIGPFDYVYDFKFSADSKDLVYCLYKDKKWEIIYQNKNIGGYDGVFNPRFSNDKKYISFLGIKKAENSKDLYFITKEVEIENNE